MYICIHIYVHICNIYTNIWCTNIMYMHTHTHTPYIHIYIYIHIYMYIYNIDINPWFVYIYTHTHTHTYPINTGGRSGRRFFCQYIFTTKTCGTWLETQSLGALGCGKTRTTPQSTWRRAASFSGKKSCGWLPSLCVGTTCMVSRDSVSLKGFFQIYVGRFWGRVDGFHLCALAQHVCWVVFWSRWKVFFHICVGLFWGRIDGFLLCALAQHVWRDVYRSLLKVFLSIWVCLLEVAQWRCHLCLGSISCIDFLWRSFSNYVWVSFEVAWMAVFFVPGRYRYSEPRSGLFRRSLFKFVGFFSNSQVSFAFAWIAVYFMRWRYMYCEPCSGLFCRSLFKFVSLFSNSQVSFEVAWIAVFFMRWHYMYCEPRSGLFCRSLFKFVGLFSNS